MRVVGTFAADESAAAKRYACPKTSVFGKLALRARANALALNFIFRGNARAPRPLRFGTRSRRTRYAPPFRAPRSRHSPTQPNNIGTPNEPARYAGLIFFHSESAVKKISPGARRFCLYSLSRFFRGAKPRPEGRGLMLIGERCYLCRLAVSSSAIAYIIVTASSEWFNSFCTFFMSISFLNSWTA